MIFWHRLRAAVEGAFNHRAPVIVEIGGGRPNDPGFAATESGVIGELLSAASAGYRGAASE